VGQVVPLRREFADLEPWVSKKEIAAYFSVSTTTIDQWTRLGLPYVQVGGRRKFRRLECDAWHRSRRP
jgi:excisionase family DNA binding protein